MREILIEKYFETFTPANLESLELMEDDHETSALPPVATTATVCVVLVLFVAGFIGLVEFYPSALAQSKYYVPPSEIHSMSRLPSFVKPISYEIHLHPIMKT